jgi:hypothetical protein
VFFLDDEDRVLVGRRRGAHMRVGFALQLVSVRWLGTFLEEPLDVPGTVLDFVAGQLGVTDPSQVKRYAERTKTRFDHQWEIRRGYGLREFTEVEAGFTGWVAARAWTSGDGPKAIDSHHPDVPCAAATPPSDTDRRAGIPDGGGVQRGSQRRPRAQVGQAFWGGPVCGCRHGRSRTIRKNVTRTWPFWA